MARSFLYPLNMEASNLTEFGNKMVNYFTKNLLFSPFVAKNPPNRILESASKFYMQDLIGEGPIAGVVDPDGYELNLFETTENSTEIFKGVYLNDYPVKNHITNTFNYNRLELYSRAGTEFQSFLPVEGVSKDSNFLFSSPGVSYSIEKTLYGLKSDAQFGIIGNSLVNNTTVNAEGFRTNLIGGQSSVQISSTHNSCLVVKRGATYNGYNISNFNPSVFSQDNFQQNFGAYHEIKDEHTDFLVLNLKANALYTVSKKGDTNSNKVVFGIEIGYKRQDDYKCYIIHSLEGIATSPYSFDLFFDVSDFDFSLLPYIKIYNLSRAPAPQESRDLRMVSSGSITEITSLKFKYPNSCYFLSVFDSRGFSQPPNRRFDMKLLKIKVPENYDAEAKSYDGYWNGEFDSVLRWSDNPAWILYDIITNYRYGLGKFSFQESLADKWSLYKIAKYCDEMVPTYNRSKFPPCLIERVSRNSITVRPLSGTTDPSEYFKAGQKIDLVNLKFLELGEDGERHTVFKNYRAIIRSVVNLSGLIQINLIKDFGLHKVLSRFSSVKNFLTSKVSNENQYKTSMNLLIQAVCADDAVSSSTGSSAESSISDFISYIRGQNLIEGDVFDYVSQSGVAAAQFDGFLPLLEPRFRANLSISNETDVVNLLNNIASTFKGMVYWSNNFVNFDNDRPKTPTYFFNNSNVKDGVFNYSGSSKDTRYTVVKIVYADESDGFQDKTVYVEDHLNIRRYGYIEKEVIGFGITSKSQARRIGEWFLTTNQIEEELVSFTAGPEALLLSPGNVISVTDELKVAGRKGGRVASVSDSIITLDSRYDFIMPGDLLSFIVASESVTPKTLNKGSNVSDVDLDKLTTTYLYKFEVEAVGLNGSFQTQVTIKTNGESTERVSLINTIAPSTLWIYDKDDSDPSATFKKDYRIIAIKEISQVEFEFTAAEYQVSKFQFIENKQNLTINNLYSSSSDNSTVLVPNNILASVDPIQKQFVTVGTKSFSPDDKYDYLIPATDYSSAEYNQLVIVIQINNTLLYNWALLDNSACAGFVAEYVINSKKISYVWRKGDDTMTTIILPKSEIDLSFEFLRVYMIGENNEYIN